MDISYKNNKLRVLCNTLKLLDKKFGSTTARTVIRRQLQLKASQDLFDFHRSVPSANCHELENRDGRDRRGEFSISAGGANRIIFIPEDEPPRDENGKMIWKEIRAIEILSVEDYHDD